MNSRAPFTKREPRNGFGALGYLSSLRSLADYLRDSSDLSEKIKGHAFDKTGFQGALDFYRGQRAERHEKLYVEQQVMVAFSSLEQVDPILRDREILGEAAVKLMKILPESIENGVAVSRVLAQLGERLRLKKKETKLSPRSSIRPVSTVRVRSSREGDRYRSGQRKVERELDA